MGISSLLATVRRDLGRVVGNFTGKRPPPFVARGVRRPVNPLAPRRLRVREVVRETNDAVSIHFEEKVDFRPGQFFTVMAMVDGKELRRAYSGSNRPGEPLRLTVKRVAGGAVSNHLVDGLRAGAMIDVLGPSGSFTLPDNPKRLVFVAGGSGITPIMAMIHAVKDADLFLLYGNRSPAEVIFADELAPLQGKVRHVYGLLDEETCARELPPLDDAHVYICGPEPMMAAARQAALARGVPETRIHEERFSAPHLRTTPNAPTQPQSMTIGGRSLIVPAGKSLLEAGLAAGLELPFSCAMGGCGMCKLSLVSGEVAMEEPNCLSPAERDAGYVLACCSRPTTAVELALP